MHVESVAWITERKDVLYSFFYMAALLSYSYYLNFTRSTPSVRLNKQYKYLVLTVIFGILSMLAKPMALSLPLILWLMDWFAGRKIGRSIIIEKIPLIAAVAGITWVTYSVHARIPGQNTIEAPLIWCWTLVFYLRQFVFPFILVPIYQLPKPVTLASPHYFLSMTVIIATVIMLWRFSKRRWVMFAFAYFFFSVFFLLRYDEGRDVNIVADRFMYLPSLGFCFLFGYGVERLLEWKDRRVTTLVAVALLALTVLLTVRTRAQNRIWHDSFSLWRHQLTYYPDDSVSINNYAAMLRKTDEYKEAEETYRQAHKLLSKDPTLDLSEKAVNHIKKVNYVIGLYLKSIELSPNYSRTYYYFGNFSQSGRKRH